ncbi:hypothetical protein PZA11_002486 [Diplocarpon coronariae]|uniref:Acetyltransferase n=1 Tax=Diplocarpon coronariae TaxID=2795749 RepID=A0A218ZHA3_9HELO|nr:hypothetical protein JHW43_001728 [Diplocarpon mali]OWP06913.1 hypothetical protein B2J93_9511 [Marssonina coronariae]
MLGKGLLTLSAAGSILGPFIADFNETHVLNPRWPPHAKFHNGQTMSLGLGLGLATLFYTYRRTTSVAMATDSLLTAAIFGSIYWITGLSAILYPGSLAVDPEFGEGFPQFWLFVGLAVSSWLGWAVESWGMKEKTV